MLRFDYIPTFYICPEGWMKDNYIYSVFRSSSFISILSEVINSFF